MDQSKLGLPHFYEKSKAEEDVPKKIKSKLIGVIVHGSLLMLGATSWTQLSMVIVIQISKLFDELLSRLDGTTPPECPSSNGQYILH
jgi:hypothetical protein